MATILYLMPGIDVGAREIARRERIANTFLTNPSNRVVVDECDEGPTSIESTIEAEMSVSGMLKKAIKLRGQYDALVIGCAGDPGINSMRELLDCPVVGPLESSLAVSSLVGDKFSLVTILDSGIPKSWVTLRKYGFDHKCASVRAINAHVLDMVDGRVGRQQVVDAVARATSQAAADGASSVVLGCMTMAFLLPDESIDLAAKVINPAKVAIKVAEMQLSLGLTHSRVSHPAPDLGKLKATVLPEL
jgi:allantoin racemase